MRSLTFMRVSLRVVPALMLLVTLGSPDVLAQSAGLKILVVEGEDAVNIVQQRTAVVPVVEVRDRNDLPMAGVPVTFTIGGGQNAAFSGGLRTLTVTTNSAGRAAATGFTPTGAGGVQINASAAFQGQTATATISQTNAATAAQAAQIGNNAAGTNSGASSAGTGGGGGGLSGTTIGIIGAAAGGGILVATKAGGDDSGSSGNSTSGSGGTSGGTGGTGGTGGGGTTTTPTTYTGPFSGRLIVTQNFTFGGIVCTHTFSPNGTLRMTLQAATGGAVTGTLDGTGGQPDSVSCNGGIVIPPFSDVGTAGPLFNGPVTGTANSLAFTQTNSFNASGTTGAVVWTFTGSLSGGVVTGTLTERYSGSIPNNSTWDGTVSIPVTLR